MDNIIIPMRTYSASIWCKEALMLLTNFARAAGVTAKFINEFSPYGGQPSGYTSSYVDFPVEEADLDLPLDEVSKRCIAPAMNGLCEIFPKKIECRPLPLPMGYENAAREMLKNFSLRCVWTTDVLQMTDYPGERDPARVVRYDILWREAA